MYPYETFKRDSLLIHPLILVSHAASSSVLPLIVNSVQSFRFSPPLFQLVLDISLFLFESACLSPLLNEQRSLLILLPLGPGDANSSAFS